MGNIELDGRMESDLNFEPTTSGESPNTVELDIGMDEVEEDELYLNEYITL